MAPPSVHLPEESCTIVASSRKDERDCIMSHEKSRYRIYSIVDCTYYYYRLFSFPTIGLMSVTLRAYVIRR